MNEEIKEELIMYYKLLTNDTKNTIHSCNFKTNSFSKNYFVLNEKEFVDFAMQNLDKDCYITYNPLKTKDNRKNENIKSLNVIALDIEAVDKQKPESEEVMILLKYKIDEFVKLYDITNSFLVNSGNGFHLYISIGKPIELTDDNYLYVKEGYKNLVKMLNENMIKTFDNFMNCDDRKDLAGILRIPGTTNTSANKKVKLSFESIYRDNTKIRKLLLKLIRQAKTKAKLKPINLLENIKELDIDFFEHPLVEMWLDEELPDETGKHNTIGFALQALVSNYGLQNTPEILELNREICDLQDVSLNLNLVSQDIDDLQILFITYNYAKEWMPEYINKIKKLINELKD